MFSTQVAEISMILWRRVVLLEYLLGGVGLSGLASFALLTVSAFISETDKTEETNETNCKADRRKKVSCGV